VDSGLPGGTVTTQTPFQVSRLPTTSNYTTVCPVNTDSPSWTYTSTSCDEVHELAFWSDLLVRLADSRVCGGIPRKPFPAATTRSGQHRPSIPAPLPGTAPERHRRFRRRMQIRRGRPWPLAASGSSATLWGLVPQVNSAGSNVWGSLYAYTVGSGGTLTHIWDTGTGHNCSSPPATGWFTTAFTEPRWQMEQSTFRQCAPVTNGNQYSSCLSVPSGSITSGILVFATCP